MKELNLAYKQALLEFNYRPLFYYRMLNDIYGSEWIKWDPVTIELTLMRDFKLDIIPDEVVDCICALSSIINSPLPFTIPNIFEKVIIGLTNPPVDFTKTSEPTPAQIAKGVAVMKILKPEQQFSNEVQTYIAFILWKDGIFFAIEPIDMVQDELDYILKTHDTYNADNYNQMKEIWEKTKNVDTKKLAELDLPENNMFTIQLYKLITIRDVSREIV